MPVVLLPNIARTEFASLRYAYPETHKLLLHTMDNTTDLVNGKMEPPVRPGTTQLPSTPGASLSAGDLLAMSSEQLIDHLQQQAKKGIKSRRKALKKSRSQPAEVHDEWPTFKPGKSFNERLFHPMPPQRNRSSMPQGHMRESLQKARDRNAGGRLFEKVNGADDWGKVGREMGIRNPLQPQPRIRAPLPAKVLAEMELEKQFCHQLNLKKPHHRKEDGMWYSDVDLG
eukprot:TRINITY_DN34094_c0_g1_i1.p1 TRINITY_DN34094_c0_g1~~TRINITY_DN34094_c0_g1_i1.p1  ORF type:complete len:228 (+),score=32.84 TRINITY_DN34094_c0_g1_i1:48-731(+)